MPAKPGSRNDLGVAISFLRWGVKGWDQETLAAASGVKLRTIKAIEQGRGSRGVSPRTLGPVLASLGFSLEQLSEVRALIRRLRSQGGGCVQSSSTGSSTSPTDQFSFGAVNMRRELLALLTPPTTTMAGAQGPSLLDPSRRDAPVLWERFRTCSEAGQLDLACEAAEFQTPGFVELLCEESRNAGGDSAARARHLAQCAAVAAAAVPGADGWRSRLQGFAGAHVANADRVGAHLDVADRAFAAAKERWQVGVADDPGLLNAARVLHLEASLRRDQRRVHEALVLLDQALEIDRWGETPTLLMGKAKALEESGQHEAAIEILLRLGSQPEAEREPRRLFVLRAQLLTNLCHLGRHAEAELHLPELWTLATELGNQLDLLRVEWVQGRVAAGLGRTDAAIRAFGRLRAAFTALDNAYDAALVTLELAEVLAALSRTAEVKKLARESAPVFHAHGLHREARQALDLFRRAAEDEQLTSTLVRNVVTFLYRSRHDAQVRLRHLR